MVTKINAALQIQAGTVTRSLHNTATSGQAVITKIIAGTNISITSSTGADAGTGDVTIASTSTVSRTTKADVNYSATASDQIIAYTSLTATRTVTLPTAASFPAARLLIIDESGAASSSVVITIVPNSGADFINGTSSVSIVSPYGYVELESNGSHNWTISDKWTLSMGQQASNSITVTGGSINNTTIGATTPVAGSFSSLNGGPLAGFKNRFINGNFDINQRSYNAVVSNGTLTYTLDRWLVGTAGAGVGISQNTPPGTLTGTRNVALINGQASNTSVTFRQRIESYNIYDLVSKPITISMQVYSSVAFTANTLAFTLSVPTNTNDTWSAQTSILSTTFPQAVAANTWVTVSYTYASLPATVIKGLEFSLNLTNWVSGNTFYIANTQLEQGSVATPYERRNIQTETLLCMRYYQIFNSGIVSGYGAANTAWYSTGYFSAPMRTSPTMTIVTAPTYSNASGLAVGPEDSQRFYTSMTITAAGSSYFNNSTFDASAELV